MLRSRKDKMFDALIILVLCIVLVIVLYPLYFVVIASVSDPIQVIGGKVILKPIGFNFEAYKRVFKYEMVMRGYGNTLMYTAAGTTLNLVMTDLAAYPLSRRKLHGKGFVLGMMMVTMFFSGGLIPTYVTIRSLRLLDTFWVMILPGALSVYNTMLMRSFFITSVPVELEEAARIDGASHFKTLTQVILPVSKAILAVMVVFYAAGHWNNYFSGLIYLSTEEKYPLQLVLRAILIQNQMQEEMVIDVGDTYNRQMMAETLKYALIIVSSVPLLLLYPFVQKYFVHGVMIGSVKG